MIPEVAVVLRVRGENQCSHAHCFCLSFHHLQSSAQSGLWLLKLVAVLLLTACLFFFFVFVHTSALSPETQLDVAICHHLYQNLTNLIWLFIGPSDCKLLFSPSGKILVRNYKENNNFLASGYVLYVH